MKTIIVMNVPAEIGGALRILEYYHKKAINDTSKKWIFVTSIPKLSEANHVKNIRFPWIKKSWFHRLFFDYLIAPYLCRKYEADEIFSLQNTVVPGTQKPQILYVHQLLPFSKKRFTLKENKIYWVYQNIISKIIFRSIKKAKTIIVQTNWVKEEIMNKLSIREDKILVHTPEFNINLTKEFVNTNQNCRTFFYPASAEIYKNHEVIVKSLEKLNDKYSNYQMIFTLTGDENEHIIKLYNYTVEKNLSVQFVGHLKHTDVLDYYSKSILIFPSYIETLGLPLLEARIHNTPIIASDLPFSREVLDGYDKAHYFTFDDDNQLAKILKEFIV